jgi:hypothetical protein
MFAPREVHVGIVMDKVALGQVFSKSYFLYIFFIHNPSDHIFIGLDLVAAVMSLCRVLYRWRLWHQWWQEVVLGPT